MSENIIFHSSWTGALSEFDIFLKRYNSQIDDVIKDGVEFEGKVFKIKIHMLVDAFIQHFQKVKVLLFTQLSKN